jgi:hypothetical protein
VRVCKGGGGYEWVWVGVGTRVTGGCEQDVVLPQHMRKGGWVTRGDNR